MTKHHGLGRKSGLCAALLLLIAGWFSPVQAQTVISDSNLTITSAQSPYETSITFQATSSSAPGALILDLSSGSVSLTTGTTTLNRDSNIYTENDTAANSVQIGQNINFAVNTNLTIGRGTANDISDIEITGNLVSNTGEGMLTINRSNSSTVSLNNSNTNFAGEIFVSSGTLDIDNYQALNSSVQLTLASGTAMNITNNVAASATVVVEGLQNSGSIDLNSHTLQINSTALALGSIEDGTLVLQGRTTIDEDTNLTNVTIDLDNGTLVVNKTMALNQTGSGTIEVGNGITLTLDDDAAFNNSESMLYQAAAVSLPGAAPGTLYFNDTDGSTFQTNATASHLTTTTANLLNIEVGAGNTWTAGNNDVVNNLTLDSSTTTISNGGVVKLNTSSNTLTINGVLTMGNESDLQTNGGTVTMAGGSIVLDGGESDISGSGAFSLSKATTISGSGALTISNLGIGANALTIAPSDTGTANVTVSALKDASSTFSGAITVNKNGKLVLPTFTTTGAITLNEGAAMQAGEITASANVTLEKDATLTSSDDLNVSSAAATTTKPATGIKIASGATIDANNVYVSGAATMVGLGTIDGNLNFTSTGTHTVSAGQFAVTGNASYKSGTNITLDFGTGTATSLKTTGNLVFNSDSTSDITINTDNYKTYGYSTVTLSGSYSSDSVTIFETGGIYGSGAAAADVMSSDVNLISLDSGGYLVESGDNLYFKIVNSGTGYTINGVTYNNGTLSLSLTARPTTNSPIEQIIINGVNANEEAFVAINEALNLDGVNKEDALNQLNPQMASAIINNNIWAAQEYASMSLQRTKMARFAMRSNMLDGSSPEAYMAATNPEVAFLAQNSVPCTTGGAIYSNPYGNPYYGAGCLLPGCSIGRQWWFRGYGGWQNQDANNDLYGYDASFAGFSIGLDKYCSSNFLLGFSAGGMWTDVNGNDPGDASAKSTSFLMDIYGSLFDESRHLDFMFGYQGASNETNRGFNYALDPTEGEFDSTAFFGGFEVGKTYHYLRSSYELFYGIQYVNMDNDEYTETGSNAALTVDRNSQNAVLQSLGFRCMRTMYAPMAGYTIVPQLEVAWVHDYKDGEIITSSAFAADPDLGTFTTVGYDIPRDRCKVALGLDIIFCTQAKFDFKYELQAGDGFGFHVLTGGFNYQF